ncbi:DUF484 family protein [Orrella sp. JC864]|uniref:DUF484 family protein n=1 Tax=Orrella sp. JC864 TaxID=3120298 RepID=UPI0012BD2132
MTPDALTAETVARFLQAHPSFLSDHADVFATLEVPHPHQSRAISLGERQIVALRERQRELELRLGALVHNATANETIGKRLHQWSLRLLAEADASRLPAAITLGLAELFGLQEAALRVWGPVAPAEHDPAGQPVSEDCRAFADTLKQPYCGTDTGFEAAQWLAAKPGSLAIVALRPQAGEPAIGLLVLAAEDAERFVPDMGTDFLDQIGELASAALRRLRPAAD